MTTVYIYPTQSLEILSLNNIPEYKKDKKTNRCYEKIYKKYFDNIELNSFNSTYLINEDKILDYDTNIIVYYKKPEFHKFNKNIEEAKNFILYDNYFDFNVQDYIRDVKNKYKNAVDFRIYIYMLNNENIYINDKKIIKLVEIQDRLKRILNDKIIKEEYVDISRTLNYKGTNQKKFVDEILKLYNSGYECEEIIEINKKKVCVLYDYNIIYNNYGIDEENIYMIKQDDRYIPGKLTKKDNFYIFKGERINKKLILKNNKYKIVGDKEYRKLKLFEGGGYYKYLFYNNMGGNSTDHIFYLPEDYEFTSKDSLKYVEGNKISNIDFFNKDNIDNYYSILEVKKQNINKKISEMIKFLSLIGSINVNDQPYLNKKMNFYINDYKYYSKEDINIKNKTIDIKGNKNTIKTNINGQPDADYYIIVNFELMDTDITYCKYNFKKLNKYINLMLGYGTRKRNNKRNKTHKIKNRHIKNS